MSNKELDEAIATLQVMETNPFDTKWKRALRLGIEALERVKILRDSVPAVKLNLADHLLPSETEE